ncbi:YbhB/YbcL family Raf kinase inhibitor-like protein [Sphaerisporangium sp. NPDC005288]|uniref:YbhB/YbcL family Raf kinase inhibitor-like protein n=1 Tax=Sphaerisporangium sp. NPDC005288 TaxID=3155114 RepID=UPI0033A11475
MKIRMVGAVSGALPAALALTLAAGCATSEGASPRASGGASPATSEGASSAVEVASPAASEAASRVAGLRVSSPAFGDGAAIPRKHACAAQGGKDISPPLAWSGVPSEARELAVVVDDPDAPGGSYIHWIVTGLPASLTGLGQGATEGKTLPGSGGAPSYAGPCPPGGTHHYHFTVYALRDRFQPVGDPRAVYARLKKAAIASGETVGTWTRRP